MNNNKHNENENENSGKFATRRVEKDATKLLLLATDALIIAAITDTPNCDKGTGRDGTLSRGGPRAWTWQKQKDSSSIAGIRLRG